MSGWESSKLSRGLDLEGAIADRSLMSGTSTSPSVANCHTGQGMGESLNVGFFAVRPDKRIVDAAAA